MTPNPTPNPRYLEFSKISKAFPGFRLEISRHTHRRQSFGRWNGAHDQGDPFRIFSGLNFHHSVPGNHAIGIHGFLGGNQNL